MNYGLADLKATERNPAKTHVAREVERYFTCKVMSPAKSMKRIVHFQLLSTFPDGPDWAVSLK